MNKTLPKYGLCDLVHIKKNLGPDREHFERDKYAYIIDYSHNSCQAGTNIEHNYGLHIEGVGTAHWYYEEDFKLIKSSGVSWLSEDAPFPSKKKKRKFERLIKD